MSQTTLGVIVGNRNFFPDELVTEGRQDVISLFKEKNIKPIMIDEKETKLGCVETWEDAKKCAALFKKHADEIDGILVVLPNFGDERGVADTIRLSGLDVPILVQAFPDDVDQFHIERRRDSFCGKISVCNNLRQYGFTYSLTSNHTEYLTADDFKEDLDFFTSVCRVVKGFSTARLGAIGARPDAFNTVRFSEKILQSYGVTVVTADLSIIFGEAGKLSNNDKKVKNKIESVKNYMPLEGVPEESIQKMAKLGVVIDDWMAANELDASAIQCWDSIQQNYGVNACGLMSMMSESFMPSACEVDVTGVLSMYALQLASGQPSALVDWNNNYGDDPDKCVLFHCGNWAKSFYKDAKMKYADILGTTLGEENTYGAIAGRVPAGPMTYARLTSADTAGELFAYVGEGEFTDDLLQTFGSRAVVEIPDLQELLQYICQFGFEHHVAMNASHVADVLEEAFDNYLCIDTYFHI